jgi:hypothetical protein
MPKPWKAQKEPGDSTRITEDVFIGLWKFLEASIDSDSVHSTASLTGFNCLAFIARALAAAGMTCFVTACNVTNGIFENITEKQK